MLRFVEAEGMRVKSGSNASAETGKSEQTSANVIAPEKYTIQ
jgi:hypothetical protein